MDVEKRRRPNEIQQHTSQHFVDKHNLATEHKSDVLQRRKNYGTQYDSETWTTFAIPVDILAAIGLYSSYEY